ncbi:hypothetical protein Salat_2913900 [Sesamum alatum]|uniref:Uncharacterized protein n=1 Tax=Sesamum alatum TaxID=300844 RepID=A0AAE2C897_9LAMI|nr:hypothetical protein Salat_2913900 [Sesamum alatum]
MPLFLSSLDFLFYFLSHFLIFLIVVRRFLVIFYRCGCASGGLTPTRARAGGLRAHRGQGWTGVGQCEAVLSLGDLGMEEAIAGLRDRLRLTDDEEQRIVLPGVCGMLIRILTGCAWLGGFSLLGFLGLRRLARQCRA